MTGKFAEVIFGTAPFLPILPKLPEPNFISFGDTLILTWEIDEKDISKCLIPISIWITATIAYSLSKKRLYRGALSIGKFVSDDKHVIGPAIADAAAWYEEADWFGVILTPISKTYLLDAIEEWDRIKFLEEGISYKSFFVEYMVPFKKAVEKSFWTIPWPISFYDQKSFLNKLPEYSKLSPPKLLCKCLEDLPKPKGVQSKYSNSLTYFEWYGRNVFPKLSEKDLSIFDKDLANIILESKKVKMSEGYRKFIPNSKAFSGTDEALERFRSYIAEKEKTINQAKNLPTLITSGTNTMTNTLAWAKEQGIEPNPEAVYKFKEIIRNSIDTRDDIYPAEKGNCPKCRTGQILWDSSTTNPYDGHMGSIKCNNCDFVL